VPVPVEAEQVIQTIVDNVLLRGKGRTVQLELALETPDTSRLHEAWDEAAERRSASVATLTSTVSNPTRSLAKSMQPTRFSAIPTLSSSS
jgi:hypothetical protein